MKVYQNPNSSSTNNKMRSEERITLSTTDESPDLAFIRSEILFIQRQFKKTLYVLLRVHNKNQLYHVHTQWHLRITIK